MRSLPDRTSASRRAETGSLNMPTHAWTRVLVAVLLVLTLSVGGWLTTGAGRGYAQTSSPQSDEFNSPSFTAPFSVICAANATPPCPDQSSTTWSVDASDSGQLRIWTLPGTLIGSANNARNLVLQPFDPGSDWTARTLMTFPANTATVVADGQTAGELIYQNDDNFLFVARTFDPAVGSRLEFVQEVAGQTQTAYAAEPANTPAQVYLRLTKAGTLYSAAYSYDGQTYVPIPAGPSSLGYTASYTSPRVGLFAFGGTAATAGTSAVAANFDWFRVSPTTVPATATPSPTATPVTPTATSVPTSATLTASPTSGAPGSSISVSGSGFLPGETVTVHAGFPLYSGNTLDATKTVTADANGAFAPVSITIPQGAQAGPVTATAAGSSSHRSGQTTLTVAYSPQLSVSPTTAPPGRSVNVTGQGFVANTSVHVSITTTNTSGANTTRSVNTTADGTGAFQTSITVPSDARPATYTVTATDTAGNVHASTRLAVALHPTVSLSAASALPGNTVTVHGTGFSAHALITVSGTFPLYGGGTRTVSATVTTSSAGSFTTRLSIPSRAAAGPVSITAQGPHGRAQRALTVGNLSPTVWLSSGTVLPGSTITVHGSGYLPNSKVDVTMPVRLTSGASSTLAASVVTNGQGAFSLSFHVPSNVAGGTYSVQARSEVSGRAPSTRLTVARLAPSIVAVPATAIPGTQVTVNGFGFAAGSQVTVSLASQAVGTATTNASGQFTLKVTVPSSLASGTYTLSAVAASGRRAAASLLVNRTVSTHFYFAALYTGHSEYLAMFNPSGTRARATITYQLTTGAVRSKVVEINPHTRLTESVNADLGSGVSAAASVAADVPIAVSRIAYRGTDGVVVPGTSSPSTIWYFANGNTSHGYVEYIAIQNSGHGPVQAVLHIAPTHHPAFNEYVTVGPTSRRTVKINNYVKDAVGVTVTSNGPVVVNRTIRIHHGITSKIGVTSPQTSWYFAGGVQSPNARHWIGVMNPSGHSVYVTLRAYNTTGIQVGIRQRWLKPYARAGYLMNKVAHQTDVAVAVQSSSPVVAEQTTFVASTHDASTDTFGTSSPAKSWMFAAVNTVAASGQSDYLDLFNPGSSVIPIAVQFMDASGRVVGRTYLVGPLSHERIDVGSVMPNDQLGIVAASSAPFVALNRYRFNNGLGADTSAGIRAGS